MILKIGKYIYDITEKDLFLDNGCCVQLLSQSKEKPQRWDRERPYPIVIKKIQKQIRPFKKVVKTDGCMIYFKLENMEQTK